MTPIDKALRLAQEHKDHTADFYRLFLRSQLLVPIMGAPELSDKKRPAATRGRFKFRIKLLRKRRILMVFDTAERLKGAFKTQTQYVTVGGGALLAGLPTNLYVLLNALTPFAKMFLPKELAWMKDVFLKEEKKVPHGLLPRRT